MLGEVLRSDFGTHNPTRNMITAAVLSSLFIAGLTTRAIRSRNARVAKQELFNNLIESFDRHTHSMN